VLDAAAVARETLAEELQVAGFDVLANSQARLVAAPPTQFRKRVAVLKRCALDAFPLLVLKRNKRTGLYKSRHGVVVDVPSLLSHAEQTRATALGLASLSPRAIVTDRLVLTKDAKTGKTVVRAHHVCALDGFVHPDRALGPLVPHDKKAAPRLPVERAQPLTPQLAVTQLSAFLEVLRAEAEARQPIVPLHAGAEFIFARKEVLGDAPPLI